MMFIESFKVYFIMACVVHLYSVPFVNATAKENEYFTSIAGLENLLKTEEILLSDLKDYVETSKQQLDILEKDISEIEREHNIAHKNVESYVANPVNVYKLINRLYVNWDIYEEQMDELIYFRQQLKERKMNFSFPSEEDFHESAVSLVRLQQTYQLPVPQVAAGILNGIKYGLDMSWMDCLVIGQQLFQMKAYNQTKDWWQESIKRLLQQHYNILDSNALDEMESLVRNLQHIEVDDTVWYLQNIIAQMEPTRYKTLYKLFENMLYLEGDDMPETPTQLAPYHTSQEFQLYEKVCRGEITQTTAQQRHLHCLYERGRNCAFCQLAPFKVEILNEDPLIRIFHDVISNEAIGTIKALAIPHMKRSKVFAPNGGAAQRNYRISKNTWLPYDVHPYLMKMLRNIHDITGLDMTYSEQLQVANYGLGGHYEPHFDFFLRNVPEQPGNRISTAIFYLSDVEQGGATAFPFLKIAVKPVKGAVLFWYNLHHSTDNDYRTKHGACPVLKGSKWIGNVWTHERNQEFSRPCLLHRDHEISLQYKVVK